MPHASDHFYDSLGQRGYYRQSHDTADLIFKSYLDDCSSVKIYQGGYMRANDLEFLREIGVGLVVNVTSNIDALDWIGQAEAPRWLRFIIPEPRRGIQFLPEINRFYQFLSTPSCAARASSSIAAQGPVVQALARPLMQ